MNTAVTLAAAENGFASVFVWSLVLVVFVLVGFFAVVWLKKRLKAPDDPAPSLGFSLSDLRALHKAGQLSDEEYERTRSRMTATLKSQLNKPAEKKAGNPPR